MDWVTRDLGPDWEEKVEAMLDDDEEPKAPIGSKPFLDVERAREVAGPAPEPYRRE